jgi:hypothetical protein
LEKNIFRISSKSVGRTITFERKNSDCLWNLVLLVHLRMCLEDKESRALRSSELNTVPLDASGECSCRFTKM